MKRKAKGGHTVNGRALGSNAKSSDASELHDEMGTLKSVIEGIGKSGDAAGRA